MVDLIDDVLALLKGDAAVMALAKGVFWVKPPGEGAYQAPFLVVYETENSPEDFADDEEIESGISFEVEIYSQGRFGALKTAVNTAMSRSGFTRSSVTADAYIPELKLFTKGMIFTIQKGVN